MENKPKNYLNDEHLSIGTREYLRVLNAGGRPVESLPVAEARKVLADVQAAVEVDLSGIDEREREIVADGHALTLHLVRPHGSRGRLPYFVFIHGGGWVLGDYPTHRRLIRDLVVESEVAAVFVDYTPSPEAKYPQAVDEISNSPGSDHGKRNKKRKIFPFFRKTAEQKHRQNKNEACP